jgi:hypothetical protein
MLVSAGMGCIYLKIVLNKKAGFNFILLKAIT